MLQWVAKGEGVGLVWVLMLFTHKFQKNIIYESNML